MKVYRFCLNDRSSILGVIDDDRNIEYELNNKKFINYKNTTSKKTEYLATDAIKVVRESSRDENGNKRGLNNE